MTITARFINFIVVQARLCVTLKCVKGAHMGQKFRLEPSTVSSKLVSYFIPTKHNLIVIVEIGRWRR